MKVRKEPYIVLVFCALVFTIAYFEWWPVKRMMDSKAARNTLAINDIDHSYYEIIDHSSGKRPLVTVDFLKGKHFWNPQIAIWLEDSTGNYLETLLVTASTAKGLFYAGRSAANFKETDEVKTERSEPTRRVDALPYWSHKRGHLYSDGFFSPSPGQPLPDGITGATPKNNFLFNVEPKSAPGLKAFRVMIEINVAFDENEYYSEYDFPEDSLYHGGTGLLGQPSIVYGTLVTQKDSGHYYIMSLLGRGHHSGATGELIADISTLTTAKFIAERIVLGIDPDWYSE